MTRDRRRKKATRAFAAHSRRSYHDAATLLAFPRRLPNTVLAETLRSDLIAALHDKGWPAKGIEPFYDLVRFDAGPVGMNLRRNTDPAGGRFEDPNEVSYRLVNPDDPAEYDLSGPLLLGLEAPPTPDLPDGVDHQLGVDLTFPCTADSAVSDIADLIEQTVADARRRNLEALPRGTRCGICGDHYRQDELLSPTDTELRSCPCCVFDREVIGPDAVRFAQALTRLVTYRLSAPAGWAAVCVLLGCLTGEDLTALQSRRTHSGELLPPDSIQPFNNWLWLPPAGTPRPPALAGLGCAASVDVVVDFIDRHHPGLRDQVRRAVRQQAPYLNNSTHSLVGRIDETIERLWSAVLAYAVTLGTQEAEQPRQRSPWQVVESLDFVEWISSVGSDLHYLVVKAVLRAGILTARSTLYPDT